MAIPPDISSLRVGDAADDEPSNGGEARKMLLIIGVLFGVSLLFAIPTCRKEQAGFGPSAIPFNPAPYRAAAKELVKQHLRDPASAEFSDVRVIPASESSPVTVCGTVNARNGFGGMGGAQRFVASDTVMLEGEVGAASMAEVWARSC